MPAVSVPVALSAEQLPLGLQLVGAPFVESKLLAIAHAFEQLTRGGHISSDHLRPLPVD